MIGEDFTFGTKRLSDFNMIMGAPDSDQEFSTRTINKSEITSVRPKPNHYGVTYDDVLRLNFLILKEDGCSAQDGFKMTDEEINNVRAWLESPKTPTELVVSLEEDVLDTYYYGLFTSVQPYNNGGECYGLYLEFTCDSPYGYSEEEVLKYTVNSSSTTITGSYDNKTAEREEYIRPTITIKSATVFGSNETLDIKNTSDGNKTMSITLPEGLAGVVIDCEKKIVTDLSGGLIPMSDIGISTPVSGSYNFISTDQFLIYWFSLIPGTNSFSITPSTTNTIKTVEISLRYIIKSGGF